MNGVFNGRNGKTPCYQCDERRELCHATCPRYAEWSADHSAQRAARRRAAKVGNDADAISVNRAKSIRSANQRMKNR